MEKKNLLQITFLIGKRDDNFFVICVCTASRKDKVTEMKLREVERQREKALKIGMWASKHVTQCNLTNTFGKSIFPCQWLILPDKNVAARMTGDDGVKKIGDSMTTKGKQDHLMNVEVLAWREDLIAAGLDPNNLVFDTTNANKPPCKLQVIVGAHTTTHIQETNLSRPMNKQYQYIPCTLYVCSKTQENSLMANAYGKLENSVKDSRNKASTWDVLWGLRQAYLETMKLCHDSDSKQFRKHWKDRKELEIVTFEGAKGTFDQLVVVAMMDEQIFKHIQTIMMGETKLIVATQKKPKTPAGIGAFKDMSDVPKPMLTSWLHRVCQGELLLADFHLMCVNYKKTQRVQNDMVEFVNTVRENSFLNSWKELISTYPPLGDDEWFQKLVTWVGAAAKEKLNEACKSEILTQIIAYEREEEDEENDKVNLCLLFIFIATCSYGMRIW